MFLPWKGLFEQIRLADKFVFYDDVQLPLGGGKGRGFSTRVQIKTCKGNNWLSVPIARRGIGKQLINQATFADNKWRQSHLSKLINEYRGAAFFKGIFESIVEPIYDYKTDSLADFCIMSTLIICEALGLKCDYALSSQLPVARKDDASLTILNFCKYYCATDYISGLGAMNYIDYALFENASVRVSYMDYKLDSYSQLYGEFTPYVSILDMLFNIGTAATCETLISENVYWKDWPYMLQGSPVKSPK